MLGYGHVRNLSPVVRENDEDEEEPERDRGHHEKVRGHDLVRMIAQKRLPCL